MSLDTMGASTPTPEVACELAATDTWHERIRIRPLARPEAAFSIRIESLLDTARDPRGVQVRYTSTLDRAALIRLREAIDEALELPPVG